MLLNPDQKIFSENFEGPQMAALSRINWNIDLKKFDETLMSGNFFIGLDEFSVNEKNLDCQKHPHLNPGLQKKCVRREISSRVNTTSELCRNLLKMPFYVDKY